MYIDYKYVNQGEKLGYRDDAFCDYNREGP